MNTQSRFYLKDNQVHDRKTGLVIHSDNNEEHGATNNLLRLLRELEGYVEPDQRSPKEIALDIIRQLTKWQYHELPAEQQQRIIQQITSQRLEPINQGHSLHAWSEDYDIDGNWYRLSGSITGNDIEVQLMTLI